MPKAEAKYRITAEDQTQRGLRSAEGRLRVFARTAATALAGAFAAAGGALAVFTRRLEDAQQRLDKFAKTGVEIGTTAAEVAELGFAATKLGVPVEQAARGVERLNRSIAEAVGTGAGAKEYRELFEELNLDPRVLFNIEDVTDRVATFARALDQIEDPTRRGALEERLFGRNLTRLLADGGQGLAREAARFRQLGLNEGINEAAAAAERAGDAWVEAGRIWEKLFERAGFFEASEAVANRLTDVGFALRQSEDRSFAEEAAGGLSPAFALGRFLFNALTNPNRPSAQRADLAGSVNPGAELRRPAANLDRAARNINSAADKIGRWG